MRCEWKPLGALVDRKIGYGIVQPGSSVVGGVPVIKVNNIISGLKSVKELDTTTPENDMKYSRTRLCGGELVISVVGTIGKTAIIPESFAGCNLVRATALIDIKCGWLAKWVKYYLDSPSGQSYINQNLNTTVQPTLNIKSLVDMPIPLFDESTIRKTINILSSFDDKIELNQKINENLERQTEAIFKAWFTDGKETNGCLADICQYSKEKVTVSSLDLDSYYSTENMLPEKAGATQAANLPTTTQTTKCNIGDVLVSNIRPYFKKIVYCYADCGCSTDVLCFVPKKKELSAYLFFLLYADAFFDFMVAGSKGTKMPRGDKHQIMMYPVYVPSDEELTEFNCIAQPVLKQIRLNREENKKLITLRDTLLPKLMAGEIDLQEV